MAVVYDKAVGGDQTEVTSIGQLTSQSTTVVVSLRGVCCASNQSKTRRISQFPMETRQYYFVLYQTGPGHHLPAGQTTEAVLVKSTCLIDVYEDSGPSFASQPPAAHCLDGPVVATPAIHGAIRSREITTERTRKTTATWTQIPNSPKT